MKKYLFIISLFFNFFCFTYAQDLELSDDCVPGMKSYNERYDKLIKMYSTMLESEKSRQYHRFILEFQVKADYLNATGKEIPDIKFGELKKWVFNNIEKTKFSDKIEADTMLKQIDQIHTEIIIENVELYKYLQESIKLCGKDILQAVYTEMIIEYGDRFHG